MPSSTSSSEARYERPLPAIALGRAGLVAVTAFAIGLFAWEAYWRGQGATPTLRDGGGLWARQRRRIDDGEGARTVIIGSSRLLFDVDLDTWERRTGERPIQLALAGTSPMFALEDLAADPDFTGRLIVGVAPDIFFSGFEKQKTVRTYYGNETLAQRASQWLSMHLVEPYLASYDADFALFTVLRRQPWPARDGVPAFQRPRRLAIRTADRNTQLWRKVRDDVAYRDLARAIWLQGTEPPPDAKARAELDGLREAQLAKAIAAVAKLRARGVEVVFVRAPSSDALLAVEDRDFPRARTWDVLLAKTGAPGIHFADVPAMQGLELPEWSHVAAHERPRFTEALVAELARLRSRQ